MTKAIEAIIVITLMVFSFFIGVKYSDSVKSHASWLFETKEEEVDLPDLTNENPEGESAIYENGDNAENPDAAASDAKNNIAPPMDDTSAEAPVMNSGEAAPAAAVKKNTAKKQ